MDIKEAQLKKNQLIRAFENLIQTFEKETELRIESLKLSRFNLDTSPVQGGKQVTRIIVEPEIKL